MTARDHVPASPTSPEPIRGVWCPALTPVDDELRPDPVRFVAHASWVMAEGCHGIVVFGTTGEASSFSVEERIALLDEALAAGLPPERMLIGTGCCALTDSVRLTRHALDQGVAGVLMLPPFYFKGASDEALFASYDLIIQRQTRSDFGLYLYHFPRLTGVPITSGLIERVQAAYPTILKGVKDSSGDWTNTATLLQRCPDLAVFPGAESLLLPGLEQGGAGCISASCNVNARAIRRLYDGFAAGAGDLATQQQAIAARRELLQLAPQIAVMKQMIADQRGDPGWRRVRPPLLPLAAADAAKLEHGLAAMDFRLTLA